MSTFLATRTPAFSRSRPALPSPVIFSSAISLWNITKKKPVFTNHLSHGIHEHTSETEGVLPTARWITSLACLPYGDVFASGQWPSKARLCQTSHFMLC